MFTSSSPVAIVLNVYDINPNNNTLSAIGVGIYHTGIEINNFEYSFGPSAGVVRTRPRLPEFGALREQITMGVYENGLYGVDRIISQLRNNQFHMNNYNLTTLNCNHFSDAFCMAALNASIPAWINRAANIGSQLNFGIDNSNSRAANRDDDGFKAPGVVKAPELHHFGSKKDTVGAGSSVRSSAGDVPVKTVAGSFSIFDWFVWSNNRQDESASPADSTPSGRKQLTEQQQRVIAQLKHKN